MNLYILSFLLPRRLANPQDHFIPQCASAPTRMPESQPQLMTTGDSRALARRCSHPPEAAFFREQLFPEGVRGREKGSVALPPTLGGASREHRCRENKDSRSHRASSLSRPRLRLQHLPGPHNGSRGGCACPIPAPSLCPVRMSLFAAWGAVTIVSIVSAFAGGDDMVEKPRLLAIENGTQNTVCSSPHATPFWGLSCSGLQLVKGDEAKRWAHSPAVHMGPVSV